MRAQAGRQETIGEGLRLTKHEAAGNDFLVFVDQQSAWSLTAELASSLCDRRRGVGADGLIRITTPNADAGLSMQLRNADGSPAEMSGNGIRCAAQAVVLAGLVRPPRFGIDTEAGLKTIHYQAEEEPWEATASVDMGRIVLGRERSLGAPVKNAREVSAGNPHLVVLVDEIAAVAPQEIAQSVAGEFPEGINVEVISATSTHHLELRVYERGAGMTLACGTGSCAAATAARSWGLVGDRVQVANPGGTLEVMLSVAPGASDVAEAVLSGPVRQVAEVLVGPALLRPGALVSPGSA